MQEFVRPENEQEEIWIKTNKIGGERKINTFMNI